MIEERYGDIFIGVKEGIIVHGCNMQGKMGGGIALQVKNLYPEAYRAYREAYERGELVLGSITTAEVAPNKIIVNAVTQEHYGWATRRRFVDYRAMRECFEKVNELALKRNLDVHFPLIGAGLANGNWDIISTIIDETLHPSVGRTLWKLYGT